MAIAAQEGAQPEAQGVDLERKLPLSFTAILLTKPSAEPVGVLREGHTNLW